MHLQIARYDGSDRNDDVLFGKALTEDCLRCWREGTLREKLPELDAHRKSVLQQTREKQKQIDCLDYLTRKIQTEEYEK